MNKNVYLKIINPKVTKILFFLCFAVYFSTYIGRLNYSAALAQIVAEGDLTKSQGGLIGTGFFLIYGIGQLISGFLGDRLHPKWLVFMGLSVSALMNFLMYSTQNPIIMCIWWSINGLAQAFIWSPMIRILYEYLEEERRLKYCVMLNTSVPLGTMAAYGIVGIIIAVSVWRMVFLSAGIMLIVVAALWLIGMVYIENYSVKHGVSKKIEVKEQVHKKINIVELIVSSGLVMVLPALIIQGTLKDGVTTWIPTYMNETYNLGSVVAIMGTMIIPLFNLLGVFFAGFVNQKFYKNEIKTSLFFFVVSLCSLLVLRVTSGASLIVAFAMLTITTTAMMAVNTMLIAVIPSKFGKMGKASTVSGILNSSVYLGGAISTYGIGSLSSQFGWNSTIVVWVILAAIAVFSCFIGSKKWKELC